MTILQMIILLCCIREVSFLPGGGAPENWGGSVTLSKIKRGIKRFFKLKRRDHLYFLKEI